MATSTLQHRTSPALWLAVLIMGLVCGALGYFAGKTALMSPLAISTMQAPITIVDASASIADKAQQVPDIDAQQLTQTVGKLHADILVLRLLYRRLAEDAGLDLTDFLLDDTMLAPPTNAENAEDDISAIESQLQQIQSSSLALQDWYQFRGQERSFQLAGPVVMQGRLSSGFGPRTSPSTGKSRMHKGVDFSGQRGEPILALADGVVSFSGSVHAYGNMVELLHADGWTTRYAHNESNTVTLGQRVEQGQIIARLGSTGRSTGPHVHLEVHLNGEAVDPMLFIQ